MRDLRMPLRGWLVPFATVGAAAGLFFALSICVDLIAESGGQFSLRGLLRSLFAQTEEQAGNTLGSLGEVMAAVLGL
ncbi:MAG TPA: hypothetical protein VM869_11850, partial [Enhygromyxa sp.]|nr:hypothetical protein [Enhygromyxa sp.]